MVVNCRNCLYFKITWEKQHPYACKALGFKSQVMPSDEVLSAAGIDCLKYTPKKPNTRDLKTKYL